MRTILACALLMIGALFWMPGAPGQVSPVAHAEARPSVTHVVTSTLDAGPGSLRAAVAAAEDGDRITFGLTIPATITLESEIAIQSKSVHLEGPDGGVSVTAARPFGSLIEMDNNGVLTATHVSFVGGTDPPIVRIGDAFGGAIDLAWGSRLYLADASVSGNLSGAGGAIMAEQGSTIVLDRVLLSGNTARYGGALFVLESEAVLRNCTIVSNTAEVGGAVYADRSSLTLHETAIEENRASTLGGAIAQGVYSTPDLPNDGITMVGCTIRANEAGTMGGGLFLSDRAELIQSTIEDCMAHTGGGIFVGSHSFTATDCVISGNQADTAGGIWAEGTITVTGGAIHGNTSRSTSGGLGLMSGKATLRDCQVTNNSAQSYGGGLYVGDRRAVLLAERVTISGNRVEDGVYQNLASGGGVALYLGTFRANDCLISGNYAKWLGGGVYLRSGTAEILASRILSNTTEPGGEGGGVYTSTSATVVRYGCIVGNVPTGFAYPGSSPSLPADATRNWWGSADGPAGEGPGDGDLITIGVDAGAFSSRAPQGCLCLPGRRCSGPTSSLPMVTKG